ncbi:MAG TPA: hypothetical protein VMZ33_07740 [Candidatus Limnocylindrales bacterium]|nr:hypothetical protein [Candidatus Limnocylindrales bacterium]
MAVDLTSTGMRRGYAQARVTASGFLLMVVVPILIARGAPAAQWLMVIGPLVSLATGVIHLRRTSPEGRRIRAGA